MKEIFVRTIINHTTWRFLLVGIINTLVGCGTMFVFYNFFHCSYWISSVANYIIGGIISFVLNKYYTFRKKAWHWIEVWKFVSNLVVCYLLAYGMAKPFMAYLLASASVYIQENVAMGVGMVLYVVLNYLGQRFFAFTT